MAWVWGGTIEAVSTVGSLPQVDLARIRPHETSQQRAWEELSFILTPWVDELPAGTRLERRATPDAGVEFSCAAPAPASGTWAWQAKYLFRTDAAAFKQMSDSVEDALAAIPDLTRYAFVLPADRSSIPPGGRGKGGIERWNEHVARWKKAATDRGMDVEFAFVGHSNVVAALSQDQHVGVLHYFFDQHLFSDEFFRAQVEREAANLGNRYDPAVHVEIEVVDSIDAMCRTPRWAEGVAVSMGGLVGRADALRRQTKTAPISATPELTDAVLGAGNATHGVDDLLRTGLGRLTTPDNDTLSALRRAANTCAAAARHAADSLHDAASRVPAALAEPTVRGNGRRGPAKRSLEDRDPARVMRDTLYDTSGKASALQRDAEAAARLLGGPDGRAEPYGGLLLEGAAGCGKSHLVADVAVDRARSGLPTLLILGQHLRSGPVWPQIAEAIDRSMTGQELRATLEVAARVRGSGRALIIIDALNEGPGRALWREQLNGFLADVDRHPWLAVVLTVRDTYAPVVLPDDLPRERLVRLVHPGLDGHEEEALRRYAEHHSLRLPDLPPLLPELRNPLYLRSLCLSLKARGHDSVPRQSRNLAWVFDGLLDAVNQGISGPDRLDVDPSDRLVHRGVTALARAMLDADSETLPLATARAVCLELHPDARHSRSLLNALVTDGLLLRETTVTHEGTESSDVVRFTYQRLADHLRADALLADYPDESALRDAVLTRARGSRAWAQAGVLEALVLLAPERRGHELTDILGVQPQRRAATDRRATDAQHHEAHLHDVLERAFFEALPWRAPTSFNDRTNELLQRYLDLGAITAHDWLSLLISLACVPDHPLNVRRLDASLRRLPRPERDLHWTAVLLSIRGDDVDPVTRTINWAWSSTVTTATDVAELAGTLLAWLCTSTDRRLRDTATKALVRLVDTRTDVAVALVARFSDVDDPYVVERVLAVACGHALRHRTAAPDQLDALASLGRTVYDVVFGADHPVMHAMMRHYGRSVVEAVEAALSAQNRHLDRDLAAVAPPYGSDWPSDAPPLRELAAAYGNRGQRYLTSATELGYDFQHYIVDRGLAEKFVLPDQARRQASRRAAARREEGAARAALLSALEPEDRSTVVELLRRRGPSGRAARHGLRDALPEEVRPALERLERAQHRVDNPEPVRPDPDLLGRWIAARVLELGWSSERFGERDGALARAREAGWSTAERFGKKYTWIAYYELLGHLADHCLVQESWREAQPEAFDTPFDVVSAVDLDPSVVLRGDETPRHARVGRRARDEDRKRRDAWWLSPRRQVLSPERDGVGWLHDVADFPDCGELLAATDPEGDTWLVVESHTTWDGRARIDASRRQLWTRSQAYVVQTQDLHLFRAWAPGQNWMGLWMPTPLEHPAGYLGGYPDQRPWPARCAEIDAERRRLEDTDPADPAGWQRIDDHDAPAAPFALASALYDSPSSRDASAVDLPRGILPSPLLLDLLGAEWNGGRPADADSLDFGPVEAEYSWSRAGRVVAFSTAGRSFGSTTMLLVRADALSDALRRSEFALWAWLLGEKIYWLGDDPQPQRAEMYAASDLSRGAPNVWATTLDYVDWNHQTDNRVRLAPPLHRTQSH